MITVPYSHYLPFLAADNNLLVLSKTLSPALENLEESFHKFVHVSLLHKDADELSSILIKHKINIVILDTVQCSEHARAAFDVIRKVNPKMVIIVITSLDATRDDLLLVRDANSVLFEPYNQQELNSKLFTTLGLFYVIKSIGRREIRLKSKAHKTSEQECFLDNYQGLSLFIVDELLELNDALLRGELSHELLKKIGDKLLEINSMIGENESLSVMTPILKKLIEFLHNIDLTKIEPGMLKIFDYLSYIIEDINQYILDIFVDRIITDVNTFIYSLRSNIDYIVNTFEKEQEDTSQLEFLND